jgi:hypothetical protein
MRMLWGVLEIEGEPAVAPDRLPYAGTTRFRFEGVISGRSFRPPLGVLPELSVAQEDGGVKSGLRADG